MKKIIIAFILLCWLGPLSAQEQQKPAPGPKKGTVTVSLILGNASTYENGSWLQLPAGGETSYTIYSPNLYNYPTENSLVNMVGAEGKWFFSDTWGARLSGAALINTSPSHEGTPGVDITYDETTTAAIPAYMDVPARENTEVIINAGVDKYFATKNPNLFWYASPVINFQYARKSGYEVSGADPTVDPGTIRYAEGWGLGLSGIAGVEYYTNGGFVFGFELRGANYTYTMNSIRPEDGLSPLRADNHNFNFLSQPMVKIGFKF